MNGAAWAVVGMVGTAVVGGAATAVWYFTRPKNQTQREVVVRTGATSAATVTAGTAAKPASIPKAVQPTNAHDVEKAWVGFWGNTVKSVGSLGEKLIDKV